MNSADVLIGVIQVTYPEWKAARHLPLFALIGGFIVIAGAITWAVLFLTMAPKQSVQFVFTEFINNSGYQSPGWVGIMSFYTPLYALYGTDGILHIAEEMNNPNSDAPRAMIWSMVISGVTTLLGAIILGFCAGDWKSYMETE
ncbi:hypothetical protein N7456_006688 [Penicillium angulare]|uniref:Amino acid transporter n=1 Tax=Penicillium angulare TaxID=116970 RepID=A0A9W9KCF5_9EURO|nr:hypothetical protein N7456_006688 [Penicillium angulare]